MDGNRRWAKAHGLSANEGHLRGYKILRELSRYALLEKKIPFVSAFVFSTENWKRAQDEVGFLMNLATRALDEYLSDFHKDNIRILVLGRREGLSPKVLKALEQAEATTKNNSAGTLALCFNYGGQQEIVDAAKQLLEQKTDPLSLDIDKFSAALYHPEVPAVDLVIRTSGEERLSGFMLWRASYAEFYFIEKHWPEFTTADIDDALKEYARRQRRYGS